MPVKFVKLLLSVLAVVVLAGCQQKQAAPSSTPSPTNSVAKDSSTNAQPQLPPITHAQPKLPTIKLYIGPEILDAEMARTFQQIRTGMMFRTNIPETDSMIFVLPVPQKADFWMKNCPESLSAAYITPDGVIAEIHHLEHDDTNGVFSASDNIQFVLETKDGWFKRHHIGTGTVVCTEKGTLAETFLRRQ